MTRAHRIVAVVPAAGSGTRLRTGPDAWTGSKEVMPVAGAPVIDHLLRRLRAAGPDVLRVVTRRDKADLVAHVRAAGCELVLGEPPDVSQSLLLGLTGLAPDDVVLSGFPDTLWGPDDGFRRLLGAVAHAEVALGLFRLPDVRAADEVLWDQGAELDRVLVRAVRPKPTAPVSSWTWACVAARAGALQQLGADPEPGRTWDRLARDRPGSVLGVLLGEDFIDVGTPEGLALAGGRDRPGSGLGAAGQR